MDNPGKNIPMRLSKAAEIAYPLGGMTAAGLRREAIRGNLAVERVAGKDFTTLAAIDEMRERCRRDPRAPVSGSDRAEKKSPRGSSETEKSKSALAAALASVKRLKGSSQIISPRNTGRRANADVIQIKSPSPTS
jgi:hypothetical protein